MRSLSVAALSLVIGCGAEANTPQPQQSEPVKVQKSTVVGDIDATEIAEPESLPPAAVKSPAAEAPAEKPQETPAPAATRTLQCHASCAGASSYDGYAWEETFTVTSTTDRFEHLRTWHWEGPNGAMSFTLDLDVTAKKQLVHDASLNATNEVEVFEGTFDFTTDQTNTGGYGACGDSCDAALTFQPGLETEFGAIVNFQIACDSL